MRTWFDNDQKIAELVYHAGLWIGTPWSANSDVMGQGVSCHNLPRAIYVSCGALAKDFPKIVGDPAQAKHSDRSIIADFLDGRPEFSKLDRESDPLLPGDLVGLRVYRHVDHLGVVLDADRFIHVLMRKNTALSPVKLPPWQQRIDRAWRIAT